MKKMIDKLIYMTFTVLIFIVLWKVIGKIWEEFVPLNNQTNLIALVFVAPIIIILSFVLSGLTFHFIKRAD